jgi:hypothetical protein
MNAKQTLPFLVAALFAAPAAWAVDTAAAATANETAGSAVAQDYVNSGANAVRSDKALIEYGRFKMTGVARVRVDGGDTASSYAGQANQPSDTASHFNIEVFPSIRLYDDWRVTTQLESQVNLEDFSRNGERGVNMTKLWAEGTVYDKVKARVGKFGTFSSYGRVLDNEVTGAELFFDYKYPTKVTAGRVTKHFNDNPWGVEAHKSGFYSVQSVLPLYNDRAHIGGTYVFINNVNNNGNNDHANFGEIGFDFKPVDDVTLMAAYSRSNLDTKDSAGNDVQKYGLFTEVKYKNADWNVRNSYDVYLNYRNVGAMSSVNSVNDYSKNVKGFQVGADYVLLKNLKMGAFYLHGKQVNPTVGNDKQDVNVWRAQVEYKF